MMQLDTWENCYDKGWKGIALDASMAHPAKFSRGLIFRIVEHALEAGLIQPGQTVLDPFGGICAGALPCLQYGLHWIGVELEPKFVELGRENIALWNTRYAAHFPNWGSAQVLQGDSRRLCEVVGAAGIVVSSPPYATAQMGGGGSNDNLGISNVSMKTGYGHTPGQLATLPPGNPPQSKIQNPKSKMIISSPPFAGNTGGRGEASRNGIDAALFDRHSGGMKKGTGDDPANLDHLPQGRPPVAIVSSPPYADSINSEKNGIDWEKAKKDYPGRVMHEERIANMEKNHNERRYGESDGQLGAMKAGEVSAVVGSPPFENSIAGGTQDKGIIGQMRRGENKTNGGLVGQSIFADYGSTDGQIGATQGQTFWEAARLIVEQCALLLPPGGAAIWVLKAYVKDGKIVDFPGQWQQLCEACGFETVHIHRAMLVKENGEQATMAAGHDTTGTTTNLLGEQVTTAGKALANKKNRTERKSFFRRLHERRRPDLAIDFETVLCMVKREAA